MAEKILEAMADLTLALSSEVRVDWEGIGGGGEIDCESEDWGM